MPRLTRLRTPVMADLAAQVRFASRPALLKQIEHAEALAAEIDPDRTYPEDWLVFRITGFTPERGTPRLLTGALVLADLSALVERLCAAAGLHESDEAALPASSLDTDQLCSRWGVSRRTVERYRREGLIARRVISDSARGRVRLSFPPAGVERFEKRRGLAPANLPKRPPRAGPDDRSAWAAWAHRFRIRAGCGWPEVIRRLARRTGRSQATIRRALAQTSSAPPPGAPPPGEIVRARPIRARERRLIARAVRAGIDLPTLARRFDRGVPAVARAHALARAEFIASLDLPRSAPLPWPLTHPALADPLLRADDGPWPFAFDELAPLLLHAAENDAPMNAATERTLAEAHARLLELAGALSADLQRGPPSADRADQAETALRWASRLRRRLLRASLPLIARTLKERGLLAEAPAPCDPRPLVRALHAASAAIHAWTPTRSGRLAAPVSLSLARELAATAPPPPPTERQPTLTFTSWDVALGPPPWVVRGLDALDPRERAAVAAHFGTPDDPPVTLRSIRNDMRLSAPAWWHAYRRAARAGALAPPPARSPARPSAAPRSPHARPPE